MIFETKKPKQVYKQSPLIKLPSAIPRTSKTPGNSHTKTDTRSDLTNSKVTVQSGSVSYIPIQIQDSLAPNDEFYSQDNIISLLQQTSEEELENSGLSNSRPEQRTANSQMFPGIFKKQSDRQNVLFQKEFCKISRNSPSQIEFTNIEKRGHLISNEKHKFQNTDDQILECLSQNQDFKNLIHVHSKNKKLLIFFSTRIAEIVQLTERKEMLNEEMDHFRQEACLVNEKKEELVLVLQQAKSQLRIFESLNKNNSGWLKLNAAIKSKKENLKNEESKIVEKQKQAKLENAKGDNFLEKLRQTCEQSDLNFEQFIDFKDKFFESLTSELSQISAIHFQEIVTLFSQTDFVVYHNLIKKKEPFCGETLHQISVDFVNSINDNFDEIVQRFNLPKKQIIYFQKLIDENMRAVQLDFDLCLINQEIFESLNSNSLKLKKLDSEIRELQENSMRLKVEIEKDKEQLNSENQHCQQTSVSSFGQNVLTFEASLQSLNFLESVNSLTEIEFREKDNRNKQKALLEICAKLEIQIQDLRENDKTLVDKIKRMVTFADSNNGILEEIIQDMKEFVEPIIVVLNSEFTSMETLLGALHRQFDFSDFFSKVGKKLKIAMKNLNDALSVFKKGLKNGEISIGKMFLLLLEIKERDDSIEQLHENIQEI